MIKLARTNAQDPDFINLVKQLDRELAERDGNEHDFYAQYNGLDAIPFVIVAYEDGEPVASGAIKAFDTVKMEVKRMYTHPEYRNRGIAGKILEELERWAQSLGYSGCLLETGKRQPEAITLYLKNNYSVIANYGQYAGVENSVCFEKKFS
ncbi:MAG: GNAT family N-acetyltransferase [Flavisolibacter sp.]